MTDSKLLPCPFCGEKAKWNNSQIKFSIQCSMPDGSHNGVQACLWPYTDEYKTEELAIKAWNTRVGHQPLIDALEATLEDLRMRAETGDDGIKVLGIGCGVLAQIEAALLAARG